MVEDGLRDLSMFKKLVDENVNDLASYGMDWDDISNTHIVGHHNIHNALDICGHNSFTINMQSEHPIVVLILEVNCPLTSEQLHWLDTQLEVLPFFHDGSIYA